MENKVKGKANEAVGAARAKTGEMTGNEKLEAKGEAQRAKGTGQQVVAKAKGTAKKAVGR